MFFPVLAGAKGRDVLEADEVRVYARLPSYLIEELGKNLCMSLLQSSRAKKRRVEENSSAGAAEGTPLAVAIAWFTRPPTWSP